MRQELESLLAQDAGQVRKRCAALFDQLHRAGAPIVLAGAGALGRKMLATFVRHGVAVSAFADNNQALHGTRVNGVEVLSAAAAAQAYGATATFIVSVFVGSGGVRRQLLDLGCANVLPFYPALWKYADDLLPHYVFDLPHKVLEAAPQVLAAYGLLADDASRAEYVANVRWRIDPEYDALPPRTGHEIYFPPDLFAVRGDEMFVDCGGFDGDTLASFLRRTPAGFCDAVVFEPDPRNFRKLAAYVETLPARTSQAVEMHQAAVGSHESVLRLETRSSTASSVSGTGETEIPCLAIDATLGERAATFIKMDIEGAEPAAIEGAARQIRLHQPLLALSAYHSQEHLWQLPLQVHALHADYRYFIRHYADEPVDALVVYAVPPGRLIAPAGQDPANAGATTAGEQQA